MLWPSENMSSIALRISYGKFDYYTGGDLPGIPDPGAPSWHDLESPIARAVGPTDVAVVNHHGSIDPANPYFITRLRPRVWIIPSWAPSHPAPSVLKRLLAPTAYPGPRDVFATVIRKPTRVIIGSRIDRLAGPPGHLVIRVEPGGGRYHLLVRDAANPSWPVISRHGPYDSN